MMALNEEDAFVEYSIYPVSKISGKELYELHMDIFVFASKYFENYLWNKEGFNLKILENQDCSQDCLIGNTCFGNNIEDEWFIVSILKRISTNFSVVIRVLDTDGEFPLIEAANILPKWAQDPNNTDKRLYLYKGMWHLIPIATSPATLTPFPVGELKISDAINTVINFENITLADSSIQSTLSSRLRGYPEVTTSLQHYAHVVIPSKLASIIERKKSLITPAIHSFFNRDNLDLKTLRNIKHFEPTKDNLVKYGIQFSKNLFAMLDSQTFNPDRKSSWFKIPLNSRAELLGMKLSCGFEILASHYISKDNYNEDNDTSFQDFLKRLNEKGYFRNLLVGSKDYKILYDSAKEYFQSNTLSFQQSKSKYSCELYEIIQNIKDDNFDKYKDMKLPPEDDDSWLNFDEETFESYLKKQFNLDDDHHNDIEINIPGKLKSFMESMSSHEGVEEPESRFKDRDSSKIDFNLKEFEELTTLHQKDDNYSSDEDSIEGHQDIDDHEMIEYFESLSAEIEGTNVEPMMKEKLVSSKKELEKEYSKPIDIDVTVLKNLMDSFNNQVDQTGPTSTLMHCIQK